MHLEIVSHAHRIPDARIHEMLIRLSEHNLVFQFLIRYK